MAELAVRKLPDYVDQDTVPGHVRAGQLRIVKALYLNLVPRDGEHAFRKRYRKNLDKFIRQLEKGRHVAT
jgi:hypothetical protein